MNDQLLNSYYYTPHFSNYVVRGLSFCLLGLGGRWGKKKKKKGETVFLLPVPVSLFPCVSNSAGAAGSTEGAAVPADGEGCDKNPPPAFLQSKECDGEEGEALGSGVPVTPTRMCGTRPRGSAGLVLDVVGVSSAVSPKSPSFSWNGDPRVYSWQIKPN